LLGSCAMSSRTRSSDSRPPPRRGGNERRQSVKRTTADPAGENPDTVRSAEVPALLKLALLVAACGAVLLAAGPFAGVVSPDPGAAYSSGVVLVVLAVLPVVLAGVLLLSGRPVGAAGVLVGSALLAVGRGLGDLQFVAGPLVASRPELAVATSLSPLRTGVGTWLLVAGDVLTLVAGALVVVRAGARPGSVIAAEFEEDGGQRKQLLGGGLAFGGLAALGLVMPAFASDNAFLLAPDLMNGPGLVMAGGLLVAVAVLLGCVFAGTARSPKLGRGVLLGIATAILGIMLPVQVAGMAVGWLHTDWRSYLATVGALGLIGVAVWPAGYAPWKREHEEAEERDANRMHVTAGVFALLAGVFTILGRATELFVVEVPTDKPISQTDLLILLSGVRPETFANRLLLPAAILMIVLGGLLLVRPLAGLIRPALSVGWVAIPLAGLSALDAVITATGTSTAIRSGAGVVWTVLALLFAIVASICAGFAGGIEREEVDLNDRQTNIMLAAPLAAAALFAIGAFGLPTMRATDFVAPGIWANFRLASWGLLLAVLAVIVAAGVAARSRPSRGAVLLFGAAAVVGVHALEFPLTAARAEGSQAGPGTWLSLACITALVISAFVALAVRPERK
jgi:hypothetical protein